MPKNWELCPALVVFRGQINGLFPDRSKVSDGTIGDAAHSTRKSDHNPDDDNLVCGMDVTDNKERGIDDEQLVKILCKYPENTKKIKYIISEGKITEEGSNCQRWKKYTGVNAHRHHVHISIKQEYKNDKTKWNLTGLALPKEHEFVAKVLPEGQHLSVPSVVVIEPAPLLKQSEQPESKPPPDPQTVIKQSPSWMATISSGIAYVTGLGMSVGTLIQSRLEAMSNKQVMIVLGCLGLVGFAMWMRSKSADRANKLNQHLIATAAEQDTATVQLV